MSALFITPTTTLGRAFLVATNVGGGQTQMVVVDASGNVSSLSLDSAMQSLTNTMGSMPNTTLTPPNSLTVVGGIVTAAS